MEKGLFLFFLSLRENQRATTKGQNRFIISHTFSEIFTPFHNFSPRPFPFKTKGFSSRRTMRRKDNKKNGTNRCCTLVVARLSSSHSLSVCLCLSVQFRLLGLEGLSEASKAWITPCLALPIGRRALSTSRTWEEKHQQPRRPFPRELPRQP